MLLHRGYRYRIYPTEVQAKRLLGWEGTLRFLWNLAHDQRRQGIAHPRGYRRSYTAFDQINQLTELRAELPWLADVPRNVCAQLLVELDQAWQRWHKGLSDAPRFKRKGRDRAPVCEPHPRQFSLSAEDNVLTFPKLGALQVVLHRALGGKPKTCAIVRDGDQWFASISCEIEIAAPLPSSKPAVAIDRGVVNLIADSDGRLVPAPRSFEKSRKKLARGQRVYSRRKRGSRNQRKARARIARIHRKARRQRLAVLHRESRHYAQNHGVVVVERLDTKRMTASARGTVEEPGKNVRQKAGLNRGILDAGWGLFVTLLAYKIVETGGRIEEVRAAFSSQTCAACGHCDPKNRRSQSEFRCVSCGHRDHADRNAAKVLLSRRTDGDAVCGGSAAGRPVKQKLRVVRRGTRSVQGSLAPSKAPAFKPG